MLFQLVLTFKEIATIFTKQQSFRNKVKCSVFPQIFSSCTFEITVFTRIRLLSLEMSIHMISCRSESSKY